MKNSAILKSITILLFIIPGLFCFSQDSTKIIMLSKDIGPIVDINEKLEFDILPKYKENFVSAIFYLSADSLYKCKLKLRNDQIITDTTIILNYSSIKNSAIRVQYLERMKKGYSNIDMQKFKLVFANDEEVKNLAKMEEATIAKSEQVNPKLYKFKFVKTLPLNRKNIDYSQFIESGHYLGVSFGILYNSEKFKGLNKIFNLLEGSIPETGYEIPKSDLTFNSFPTFTLSSFLVFAHNYMLEFKYGFNLSTNESKYLSYTTFLASLGYLQPIFMNTRLYGAIGFTGVEFNAFNKYGVLINGNSGSLESIKLHGKTKGIKLILGIKFNVSSSFIIDFTASQNFYSNLEIINTEGHQLNNMPKINIDSYDIGISFSVTNN